MQTKSQKSLVKIGLFLPFFIIGGLLLLNIVYSVVISKEQINLEDNGAIVPYMLLANYLIYLIFKLHFKKTSLENIANEPEKFINQFLIFNAVFTFIIISLFTLAYLAFKYIQQPIPEMDAIGIGIFLFMFIAQGIFSIIMMTLFGFAICYAYIKFFKFLYGKLSKL